MNANDLSLRKLATILGVSQPFLSQIRAGKRPLPADLKTKIDALGAYHLLIGDKQNEPNPQIGVAVQKEKATLPNGLSESNSALAGVRGSRTHLPRSSRGITDLKTVSFNNRARRSSKKWSHFGHTLQNIRQHRTPRSATNVDYRPDPMF